MRDRIKLLYDGGIISHEVKQLLMKALDWLRIRGVKLDDEQGQMFLTHLAMALERIKRGEEVGTLTSDMLTEIEASRGYSLAQSFIGFIEEEGEVKLPPGEKGYILLHVCALVEREG